MPNYSHIPSGFNTLRTYHEYQKPRKRASAAANPPAAPSSPPAAAAAAPTISAPPVSGRAAPSNSSRGAVVLGAGIPQRIAAQMEVRAERSVQELLAAMNEVSRGLSTGAAGVAVAVAAPYGGRWYHEVAVGNTGDGVRTEARLYPDPQLVAEREREARQQFLGYRVQSINVAGAIWALAQRNITAIYGERWLS